MRFDNRAISAPPTRTAAVWRHGPHILVEVWANRRRFKLLFDRFHNLVSIHRWARLEGPLHYYSPFCWRIDWHRAKRRKRSLQPLHVDIVCCALAAMRREEA